MPSRSVTIAVVCSTNGADHRLLQRSLPAATHALAGVATPAFNKGMGSKIIGINRSEFCFVEPYFRTCVDLIAVIKHEAGSVGVTEIFKVGNLDLRARLAVIEVVEELLL